jgi:antagonist of KipI
MSITIIKPGILSTLQDAGRYGHRQWGITPGGVMDIFAATMANRLAGNTGNEAVLEMHFPAAELLLEEDVLLGIAGADFNLHINNEPAANWQSHYVTAGSTIRFQSLRKGCRVYMAVHGGWQAHQWLGSYATHSTLGVGGYGGRALQKKDRLQCKAVTPASAAQYQAAVSKNNIHKIYGADAVIDCLPGPEFHLLNTVSQQQLLSKQSFFQISPQSNRMGYRLLGPPLQLQQPVNLLSSAVSFGTVQLTSGGELIILMADHQTTGGYPRIVSITAAHLPKLAQLPPGSFLQFRLVSMQEAEESLISFTQLLRPA